MLSLLMSLQAFNCSRVLLTLCKCLQNWGDYADMNQGVAVYMTLAADVLLICWLGTQLTQHVRVKDV